MHLLNCWRVESTQDSLTIQCDQHPNAVDVTYWSTEQYVSWCLSLLRCYLLLVSYFSISLQIDEILDISWRDFFFHQIGLWDILWLIYKGPDFCGQSHCCVGWSSLYIWDRFKRDLLQGTGERKCRGKLCNSLSIKKKKEACWASECCKPVGSIPWRFLLQALALSLCHGFPWWWFVKSRWNEPFHP